MLVAEGELQRPVLVEFAAIEAFLFLEGLEDKGLLVLRRLGFAGHLRDLRQPGWGDLQESMS